MILGGLGYPRRSAVRSLVNVPGVLYVRRVQVPKCRGENRGRIGDDGYFLYFCSAEVAWAAEAGVHGLVHPERHE